MAIIKIIPMPGKEGKSAYQVAVDNGFVGTEQQWLDSLGTSTRDTSPLPTFLTYSEGRNHLPTLNSNFGWDENGVWFSGDASGGGDEGTSYPIFTNSTFYYDQKVEVRFDAEIDSSCTDLGVCVYIDGTIPEWNWNYSNTRIAAQFNCPTATISGLDTLVNTQTELPAPGIYTYVFTYDPLAETDKVKFEYFAKDSNTAITTLTLNQNLNNEGSYRIGFAADMDGGPEDNGDTKSYMSNLIVKVDDVQVFSNSLKENYSGASGSAITDLSLPLDINDENGLPLITFEKSYTGTVRIVAPQDDLAIRSARDILLYAGNDGPGNVYIGWGDAEYTPDSTNRVATIGDLNSSFGHVNDIQVDGAIYLKDYNNNSDATFLTKEVVGDNISVAKFTIGDDGGSQINSVYPTVETAGPNSDGFAIATTNSGVHHYMNVAGDYYLAGKVIPSGGVKFADNSVQTIAYPGAPEVYQYTPLFSATGLSFTGTDTSYPTYNSYYVKNGRMVTFWIELDFATVNNFGTGQYKLELPFAPLAGTMNHFNAWLWVNPSQDPDVAGHHVLVADHLAGSQILDLHYLKGMNANSAIMEQQFKQGYPDTLTTASKVYVNGTYISAS